MKGNNSKSTNFLSTSEVKKLFALRSIIADTTADFLEDHAEFSEDFLDGLQQSHKEARSGKVRKIRALSEAPARK